MDQLCWRGQGRDNSHQGRDNSLERKGKGQCVCPVGWGKGQASGL